MGISWLLAMTGQDGNGGDFSFQFSLSYKFTLASIEKSSIPFKSPISVLHYRWGTAHRGHISHMSHIVIGDVGV
jgi:hypothetical protein